MIRSGEVIVDDATYTAKIGKRHLDLTFKEFELLKFLAQHPGRVFTRQQLLQEVWGYDYFGGTRTVDVHVRRLRAKLGPDNETLIGTVRNVGYRFVIPAKEPRTPRRPRAAHRGGSRGAPDAPAVTPRLAARTSWLDPGRTAAAGRLRGADGRRRRPRGAAVTRTGRTRSTRRRGCGSSTTA